MNENNNKTDLFDLGSEPVEVDFDPFAEDEMADDSQAKASSLEGTEPEVFEEDIAEAPNPVDIQPDSEAKTVAPAATPKEAKKPQQDDTEKPPVFEYAGATEAIEDTSKTFDELRIEKSSDFPELEDGKRVSWTMEYGKITKIVADPKGMSIGKMKSDIETSKEFADSLKKRGADKNPICKVKPRVTAQSKGVASAYKGVFCNMEEAEMTGKIISIVPAKLSCAEAALSAPQSIVANIMAATAIVSYLYNILVNGELDTRSVTFSTNTLNIKPSLVDKSRRKAE